MARNSTQKLNIFLIILFMCVLLVEFKRVRTREPFRKWWKKRTKRSILWGVVSVVALPVGVVALGVDHTIGAIDRHKKEVARKKSINDNKNKLNELLKSNNKKKAAAARGKAKEDKLADYRDELSNKRSNELSKYKNIFDGSSAYKKIQRGIESNIRKTAEDYQFYLDEYDEFYQKKDDEILNDKSVLTFIDGEYVQSKTDASNTYNAYKGTINQRGIIQKSEGESNDSIARKENNNMRVSNILA